MKRLIFIFLAVALGMSSHEVSGRVLVEPDTLTFRKTWQMPGMSAREVFGYTYFFKREFFHGWDLGSSWKHGPSADRYSRMFVGIDLAGRPGKIFPKVNLIYRDNELEVIMDDIYVDWYTALCLCLSTRDDKFNRSRSWLRTHDKEVLDAARAWSAKLFEELTAALDEYLKCGPPIEMKEM